MKLELNCQVLKWCKNEGGFVQRGVKWCKNEWGFFQRRWGVK